MWLSSEFKASLVYEVEDSVSKAKHTNKQKHPQNHKNMLTANFNYLKIPWESIKVPVGWSSFLSMAIRREPLRGARHTLAPIPPHIPASFPSLLRFTDLSKLQAPHRPCCQLQTGWSSSSYPGAMLSSMGKGHVAILVVTTVTKGVIGLQLEEVIILQNTLQSSKELSNTSHQH